MENTMTTEGFKVLVLQNGRDGAVIAGQPGVLSALCARLGFKNACRDGRVYLTAPKVARLGLASVPSQLPGWERLGSDELRRISMEVR